MPGNPRKLRIKQEEVIKDEPMDVETTERSNHEIPLPVVSDGEEEIDLNLQTLEDPCEMWQYKLAKRKRQLIKVKSRMKSYQLRLEEQDEQLKSLQEQIAKKRASCKRKTFDWTAIKSAHLISKVFEHCEPVPTSETTEQNGQPDSSKSGGDTKESTREMNPKNKCLYTADFHRFAIALYFFSPKAYFFLSNIAPMFPHRNYIRQWVTSGRVEKLFPQGVFRDEFTDFQ